MKNLRNLSAKDRFLTTMALDSLSKSRSIEWTAIAGPSAKLDLRHQHRLHPVNVAGLSRGVGAPERTRVGRLRLKARKDAMIAAVHADQERAKTPVLVAPAADNDFMAGATFGLGPVVAAARMRDRPRAVAQGGHGAFERTWIGLCRVCPFVYEAVPHDDGGHGS